MSILRSDSIKNRAGTGAPDFPNGATVTGIVTATTFKGGAEITSGTAAFSGNVSVGGVLSYEDVTNVDSVGIVTARGGIEIGAAGAGGTITSAGSAEFAGIVTATSFYGDGANLDNVVSGVELKQAGTSVGTACTQINFASGATLSPVRTGISTVTISAGISTEALITSGITTVLNLAKQEHKITATGICTITCTGGTETDSHTLRIINSGISTVGFSTYFLWPSGAAPTLPTTSGAISLISFTVNRVGAGGTQLLSGASLNYS